MSEPKSERIEMSEPKMAACPPTTCLGNDMELYVTGTGQEVWVHPIAECKGEHCVIHRPSQHAMSSFPTHWRGDRGLMERICPHGVGHPDPDDLAFKATLQFFQKNNRLKYESVHGCDGCCQHPDEA